MGELKLRSGKENCPLYNTLKQPGRAFMLQVAVVV